MSYALRLHVGFFYSGFVPSQCLFTGASDRLKRLSIDVTFPDPLKSRWWLRAESTGWSARFWVPARRWAHWIFRHRRSDVFLLWSGFLLLGAIGFMGFIVGWSEFLRMHLLFSYFGCLTLWLLCLTLFVAGLLRLHRPTVWIEIHPHRHEITIHFPAHLLPVYELYAAAWGNFVDAGSPMFATILDADQGWEDTAAGFDQGGR